MVKVWERGHTHARDGEGLGMRLHTLEIVKALERGYTHTHARDGERLGMRLHTHTHTHTKDGEGLRTGLHTHTHKRWLRSGNEETHMLEMAKARK